MLSEPPATKPRRNWHLLRWAFLLIALSSGWGAWKAYDFRQALKEAKALGWQFEYNDPIAIIRDDWRDAFRKQTWEDTGRLLEISPADHLEGHSDVIRRLEPIDLHLHGGFSHRDLSELKGLSSVTGLWLFDCPNLANIDTLKEMNGLTHLWILYSPALASIDALKELKNLEVLDLRGCSAMTHVDALRNLKVLRRLNLFCCTGLKNVDGLLGLTGLEELDLQGCTGLAKDSLATLKAALPNTRIRTPDENGFTQGGRIFILGGRIFTLFGK